MSDQDILNQTHRVGAHQITLEDVDQFHVKFIGDTSLAQALEITGWVACNLEKLSGAYLVCDLREAGSLDAETRKLVAVWVSQHQLSAIANYGGGLVTRTLSNLAIRAIRALHRQPTENRFFSSEAESRAWIAEHRKNHTDRGKLEK